MATTPTPAPAQPPRTRPRKAPLYRMLDWTVAGALWGCSVYTTWLLVVTLAEMAPDVFTIAAFLSSPALIPALIIQAAFSALESRVWHGQRGWMPGAALALDVFTNAGGLWQWTKNLPDAPHMVALNQMIESVIGVSFGFSALLSIAATILIGFLLAYTPEALIRDDRTH